MKRLPRRRLHRRRRRPAFNMPRCAVLECSFSGSRNSGSQAQVLLVECQPKRERRLNGPALKRERHDAGCGGDVQVDDDAVWLQSQWGMGPTPYSRSRMHGG